MFKLHERFVRSHAALISLLISFGLIAGALTLSGCSEEDDSGVTPTYNPVRITSAPEADATGGLPFVYRVTYDEDNDGVVDSLAIFDYPSWLIPDADSIFGTPADGLGDTSFTVVAYEGEWTDTLRVTVNMIPCILVYGDTRTGHTEHQTLVDSMILRKPAAVFHTGDLVNDGTNASDWTIFLNITSDLRNQAYFFPALGNHELQSYLFFQFFSLPGNEQWYSIEMNYTHFIVLNSVVDIGPASEQYAWLVDDLAAIHDSIKFVVAVFHHPPYSTGYHAEDEMGLRQTIVPIFQQNGVDIVFNGHDHDYERSNCGGIYYIVTGGGGAPLRDQARTHPCSQLFLKVYHYCKLSMLGDRLVVTVFDIDNQQVDRFEVQTD